MVGIITWFANYRAVPGSRVRLFNPEPSLGLTKAFSGDLGKDVVIDQLETGSPLPWEVGYWWGTWRGLKLDFNFSLFTSMPKVDISSNGYWLTIYLGTACVHSLPVTSTALFIFFLLIWVKLFDKNSNWESYVLQIFFPIWHLSFLWYTFCHMETLHLCQQMYQYFPMASGF